MELSQLLTAESLAYKMTENPSNKQPFLLEAWFPTEHILGRDIKWLRSHKNLGIALAPSNEDARPVIRSRGEIHANKQEMPLFREQMKIDENDYFNMMRVQSSNDPYAQQILKNIYNDGATLLESARISVERMRAQLLSASGGFMGITIGTKDNTLYNYNYDPDNSWKNTHYVALSGSSTWDNTTTATPLTDLQERIQYLSSIGVVVKYLMMNSSTLQYLTNSAQVKNSLITVTGATVDFMTDVKAKAVIQQTLGVELFIYDKAYIDYDGTSKKFYPDGYVTLIGDGTLGTTYFGTTAEERTLLGNPNVEVSVIDPGIAVAIVTKPGPPVETLTTVSQVVLPSFEGMDNIAVIKVA